MKVYKNSKGYYCRAYDKASQSTKYIHGKTPAEAKRKAMLYESAERREKPSVTFGDAFELFVDNRSTLSPNTIRTYRGAFNAHLAELARYPIENITPQVVQRVIDNVASVRSYKTTKNTYALITSVLRSQGYDKKLYVRLPQKEKKEKIQLPSREAVEHLIDCAEGETKLALKLAVQAGLRRSEIAALLVSDLDEDNVLHIRRAYAKSEYGGWVLKPPKSYKGNRDIKITASLAEEIRKKKDKVVDLMPSGISSGYERAAFKARFPFNLHMLRHWSASYLSSKGVSDQVIMQRFGWSDLSMLKNYGHIIEGDDKINMVIEDMNF